MPSRPGVASLPAEGHCQQALGTGQMLSFQTRASPCSGVSQPRRSLDTWVLVGTPFLAPTRPASGASLAAVGTLMEPPDSGRGPVGVRDLAVLPSPFPPQEVAC